VTVAAGATLPVPTVRRVRPRVLIRPPTEADQDEFIAAVRRSRRLHQAWVSPPATALAFRQYLDRQNDAAFRAFVLCEHPTGAAGQPAERVAGVPSERLAGVFNLSQIVLGGFCSAYLGYYAFAGCEGRGLMQAGMKQLLKLAFGTLGLHRVEANIQPVNLPSIALVRACGFALEGYSPRYLKIGGRWRDHERWAVLADRR
jgi:ribosomal-protein-alanine N-acetyltransferase